MENDLNELYARWFDAAPIGFAISDEQGRVVDANMYLLEIGGYSREDLIGKMASDFYAKGPLQRREILDRFARQGRLDNYEVPFRKKDGMTFPARMSLRPCVAAGRRYIIAMIKDISDEER